MENGKTLKRSASMRIISAAYLRTYTENTTRIYGPDTTESRYGATP